MTISSLQDLCLFKLAASNFNAEEIEILPPDLKNEVLYLSKKFKERYIIEFRIYYGSLGNNMPVFSGSDTINAVRNKARDLAVEFGYLQPGTSYSAVCLKGFSSFTRDRPLALYHSDNTPEHWLILRTVFRIGTVSYERQMAYFNAK
jgi:hypothetical protein